MRRAGLWTGIGLVAAVVLVALLSLLWTPFDPLGVDPASALRGPGWPHPLGTNNTGQDQLSRMMVGARICLMVGIIAVSLAALIGVPLGIWAGMARGWVGEVLLRAADVLYAFPALLLAILFAAAFGGSTVTAMCAIGIATVPAFLRVARAGTLLVMSTDYVLAARAAGTGRLATALRHVLPNIAPLVGVQASVSFGIAILAEAALSYLGLATPPTTPTWGSMLRAAQEFTATAPLLAVFPGLAIAGAVLGFNLLGDGLRDLLDPRLKEVS